MTAIAKPSFAGTCEEPCSRNWWIEEYDDGKFRIMAGDNRSVMCRGDGYLSRKYAKRMGEWLVELAQKCSKHNDDLSGRR